MHKIFYEIVNNSITASILIVVVIVLRMILKRVPKWNICLLWAMVGIRLVMPFEIESRLSLVPNIGFMQMEEDQNILYPANKNQKDELYEQYLQGHQEVQQKNGYLQMNQNNNNTEFLGEEDESAESYRVVPFSKETHSRIETIVSYIWLIGVLVLAAYAVTSFWVLKRKVAASVLLYDNIYLCDEIDSPFVMGIMKPQIYLSSKTPKESWDYILKHETAHIKRVDHIWKLLGYALLAIYWFNPLSWISYLLFCKDMELACDEKAIKDMDKNQRADYCEALLTCSVNRKKIDVCPVAFGEVGVKERIKKVINYKKPTFWMILLAIVVCVVVAVCFMTSPESKEKKDAVISETTEAESGINSDMDETEKIDNTTEYEYIEPDEQGYRWLTEERDVYVYEFADLDKNGIEEYAKVYQIDTEQEYICRYIFYWNGEAIYEYVNSYGMSPGEAEYLDLDRDGEKEIFLTFWPHANSMPLMEYIVLKQKADSSWKPVLSCEGLEKTVTFDIAFYHTKLMELWEKDETETANLGMRLINDYKYGFPETSEWYTFGSVCAWGIWNIKSDEYQGQPCLIATHGIQGYDKFDFWGELDVYFDYDAQGKIRFLDMEFRNSESWAGREQ